MASESAERRAEVCVLEHGYTDFAGYVRCDRADCEPCRLAAAVEIAQASGGPLERMTFECHFWTSHSHGWDGVTWGRYWATLSWSEGPSVDEVCQELRRVFGYGELEILSVDVLFDLASGCVALNRSFESERKRRAFARSVVGEIDAGRDAKAVTRSSDGSFGIYRSLLEAGDPLELSPPEEQFLSLVRRDGTFDATRPSKWLSDHWEELPALVAEAYRLAGVAQPETAQPETAQRLHERVTTPAETCDSCGSGDVVAMVVAVAKPFDEVWAHGRPVRPVELGEGRVLGAWCEAHQDQVPSGDYLRTGWNVCRKGPGGFWVWPHTGVGRGGGGRRRCGIPGCRRTAAFLLYIANDDAPFLCQEHTAAVEEFKYWRWDEDAQRWRDVRTGCAQPGPWEPSRPLG